MKKNIFILSAMVFLLLNIVSCDFSSDMHMKMQGKMMMEKYAAKSVVIKMINSVDTKQWKEAEEQFAETVFVDYSSLNNQAGADANAADLVAGWEKLLGKLDTHHMVTNFQVELSENTAKVHSYVYASHSYESVPYWDIFGRYLFDLEKTENGWKITSMTFIVHGQRGNKNFVSDVQEKNK